MTTERTHTPGDWHIGVKVARSGVYGSRGEWIADCDPIGLDSEGRQDIHQQIFTEAAANARLIALAPTAPHECAPDCPGEQNRRKLAAHDALVTALDGLLNELDSRAEKRSWDTHRAALALARGDA